VLAAALAGCGGGGGKEAATTTHASAGSTPAQALGAVIAAAYAGDATRLRSLLTPESIRPAGATLAGFSARRARTLYRGGDWAVAWVRSPKTNRAYAAALKRAGGRWRVDLSRRVRIRILGPNPGERAAPTPQVAAGLSAPTPLAESGLWVDGMPLEVKGGGTPTRGTIYGAPAAPLTPGPHVAVAFARTGRTGTATAWTFTV
jgi:hypothetical protein